MKITKHKTGEIINSLQILYPGICNLKKYMPTKSTRRVEKQRTGNVPYFQTIKVLEL